MDSLQSELAHLLQNNQSSDSQTIDSLVRNYYEYVYRLALSILGNRADADDAAQETFIAMRNNIHKYSPGTNFKAWISKIALNQSRMLLRKQKTRQTLANLLQSTNSLIASAPSPETSTLQNEANHNLWLAVDKLSEKHRIPIILRYVHDLPIREIAEILVVKEGTVHSRLHYGVRKLSKQIRIRDDSQTEKQEKQI
jgi:RNA polymerase sigma-70 factor (ECF subfamily)